MPVMEITTKIGCRVSCAYCPQQKFLAAYRLRSDKTFMTLIDFKNYLAKVPTEVDIEFSGFCEPWLNPECAQMVLYAHEKGHQIKVFTTLTGMTLADADLIKSVPFKEFALHLPTESRDENITVDENYLQVLAAVGAFLAANGIKTSYHVRGQKAQPQVEQLLGDRIKRKSVSTRAANLAVKNVSLPVRKRGEIACACDLRETVLLPNGEVTLCTMDYGLKHVLGDLTQTDYGELFQAPEFLKVAAGLKDESLDILCRYCDMFAVNRGRWARVRDFCRCSAFGRLAAKFGKQVLK